MNTKTLSQPALAVIDQYLNFHVDKIGAVSAGAHQQGLTCSIPYYNNKRNGVRGGLRALSGKGSPRDIFDEVEIIMLKEKIPVASLTDETFKWFLVDHNIGIDCSGFAYYILNAEGHARGKKSIERHLSFPLSKGFIRKIRCLLRPVGNTGVGTFAHAENSTSVLLKDIQVGDMITMLDDDKSRDHILVVHQIEYQNFIPTTIHYSHSIAWPTDGQYNHGVRQGKIDIIDINKPITEQIWSENETFTRSQKAKTDLRRLKWFV
jgi:hypothetical protein